MVMLKEVGTFEDLRSTEEIGEFLLSLVGQLDRVQFAKKGAGSNEVNKTNDDKKITGEQKKNFFKQ